MAEVREKPEKNRGRTRRSLQPPFSGRDIPLDGDFSGMPPRLRHIVRKLHAEKVVHVRAERLFYAQGHLRRERGLAVEKVREGSSANLQNLRRLRDVEAEGLDDLGSDQVARMGRVLHGHCGLLVVVDQVHIAGGVRLFVVAENQAPVSSDGQAPESFQTALERVQFPSGKPADLVEAFTGFKGEQKLAQLIHHRGWHPPGVIIRMELPQPFVAKADKPHLSSAWFQYVR